MGAMFLGSLEPKEAQCCTGLSQSASGKDDRLAINMSKRMSSGLTLRKILAESCRSLG